MSIIHYYSIVEWELEQMSRYLDTLQDSLNSAREEYFEILRRYEMPDDQLGDVFYDEIVEVRDYYPQLFYSGFVITWYTFIERELLRICRQINREIRDDQNKFGNVYIRTSRRFLQEQANYSIDGDHWQELKFVQKVRNCIAHGSTEFRYSLGKPNGKNKIVPLNIEELGDVHLMIDPSFHRNLEQHGIIKFSGPYFVISPTHDFCKHLVDFGTEFLSKIYKDLKPRK
jgi:hypothetical protein